jgi:hypothetical protein
LCLSSDDFSSDSSLVCGVFNILMFCLSSCTWFLLFLACVPYPGCWYRCPEIGTSSIDWAELITFHLNTVTESSPRNTTFLNKKQDDE